MNDSDPIEYLELKSFKF